MASDSFTRANETPLASPWVSDALGGVNLASNAVGNSAGADKLSYYGSSSVLSSQVKATTAGDGDGGPAICCDGASNFYMANGSSGTQLYKVASGSPSSIGSSADVWVNNDVIRIYRSGGNVIISRNGTDIVTVADSTFTTGSPGIFCFSTAIKMDDWTDGAGGGSSLVHAASAAPQRNRRSSCRYM